jgi:hypothetical protein
MMSRIARPLFSLIAISAVFSGAFAIAEGCGSDSFTSSPSTDGGGEGSAATDASQDAGPQDSGPSVVVDACVKPPTAADLSLQPFCDAYAEISSRCLDCASCRQSNATACEGLGATLSASLRSGIVACKDTIACSALESQVGFVQDSCVVAHLLDGGVTNTQILAQTTYCTTCGGDAGTPEYADCEQNYFGQPDGGSNAPGAIVLVSSDDVASAIKKNCGNCAGYGGCSVFYFCIGAGKDTCTGSNALCHN